MAIFIFIMNTFLFFIGRKAEKKQAKKRHSLKPEDGHTKNPKAFTFNSAVKAARTFRRYG